MPSAYANSDAVIWKRGDQIVQLVQQDDNSAPPNDHPISTTGGEIEAMLNMLRLRYVDEESDAASVSIFTQAEIDNLGSAIASGLGRAVPSEDVIFHVIGVRRLGPGAFAKRNRVSAGRFFYRDGNLNVIFGQIQTPYRKKNLYGQTDQDFYPRNYGSRVAAAEHDVVILANSTARHYQSSTGVRPDWIVMDPGVAAAVVDETEAEAPTPTRQNNETPIGRVELPVYPEPPIADNHRTNNVQADGMDTSSSTASVEQRLHALKQLRERDLISEDAYQTKMKEILQDL